MFLIDSWLGDLLPELWLFGGLSVVIPPLSCVSLISVFALISGDFRFAPGEHFSRLSDETERGVQLAPATPLRSGDWRSSFVLRSSIIIGVVSPEVMVDFLPPMLSSRLIVGLSTKLSELHSSDVGDTKGVSVVSESGFTKNVSRPSPRLCDKSVKRGRVGARTFWRFGRLLTRCWSVRDWLGNSVIESQFSSSWAPTLTPRFDMLGDSSRSGMWLRLWFPVPRLRLTTLIGLVLVAMRFALNPGGTACDVG